VGLSNVRLRNQDDSTKIVEADMSIVRKRSKNVADKKLAGFALKAEQKIGVMVALLCLVMTK
jgi:hypothetical protein